VRRRRVRWRFLQSTWMRMGTERRGGREGREGLERRKWRAWGQWRSARIGGRS